MGRSSYPLSGTGSTTRGTIFYTRLLYKVKRWNWTGRRSSGLTIRPQPITFSQVLGKSRRQTMHRLKSKIIVGVARILDVPRGKDRYWRYRVIYQDFLFFQEPLCHHYFHGRHHLQTENSMICIYSFCQSACTPQTQTDKQDTADRAGCPLFTSFLDFQHTNFMWLTCHVSCEQGVYMQHYFILCAPFKAFGRINVLTAEVQF